ncbi:MAG: LysE/ArgO family amino acid transporter [Anaerolineaceae bacterium]
MPPFNMFLQGLLLGFSIAAPVGPIGVLCIRRTLAGGRLHGFISGLGAATADGCYGLVAAFGLTALSGALLAWQTPIRLLGGLFLLYLAARIFFTPLPRDASAETPAPKNASLAGDYLSTFLLTLSNPMTILSFTAIFAGLGLAARAGTFNESTLLVAGVFAGSAAWWLTLSLGVGFLRSRVSPNVMAWINRGSGLIIAAFGLAALVSILA